VFLRANREREGKKKNKKRKEGKIRGKKRDFEKLSLKVRFRLLNV
jgi:hypothetical protein